MHVPHLHAVLGPTAPEIDFPALADLHVATIEKSLFSMMVPEVRTLLRDRPHVSSVVLFGIEVRLPEPAQLPLTSVQAHVCVLQTALDLIRAGYDVHVLADGVSSCNREEVPIALACIRQAGGHVTTSESIAFQLQRQTRLVKSAPLLMSLAGESGTPRFKAFSAVIKEERENTAQASQKLLQYRSRL